MLLSPELIEQVCSPPRRNQPVLDCVCIRQQTEDFQVEEIPAYELSGSGDHAWLWVEKKGLSSPEMISRLTDRLRFRPADAGLAGQKDRHAVTRQYVSIPGRLAVKAMELQDDDLRVLSVTMHRNKLKTGHLKGNRFRLVLRPANRTWSEEEKKATEERLQLLEQRGFPNYYGPQRFGFHGNTLIDGLRLLNGTLPKDHWPENQSRRLMRLALSAVQSAVFNLVTGQRVLAGTEGTAIPGDVVIRKGGIKPFVLPAGTSADDYLPAGPMPGPEMVASQGDALAIEQQALQQLQLKPKHFERFAKLTSGARRRMIEVPSSPVVTLLDDGSIQVEFSLSSGTYATTLLREVAASVVDRLPDGASEDGASSVSE